MPHPVIYFDVDDTIVRSTGTKRYPIPATIQKIRELHAMGVTMYLWSRGGAEYAKTTAAELGLTECFAAFLAKPTHIVDDQAIADWSDLAEFHPNQEIVL